MANRTLRRSTATAVSRCNAAAARPRAFRVLIFMPIGSEHSDIASDKCSKLVSIANASLYLAHYDDSRDHYARMPWYRRVEFTALTPREIKIALARRLLIHDEAFRDQQLPRFSHVWVTDDDVAFPHSHFLNQFLHTAMALDAAIVQPATAGSVHGLVRPDRSRTCAIARATDFVEFQSPLMERCVFLEAVGLMHHGSSSDYGLDMVWCRWIAAQPHSRWSICTVCAVIEADGFEKRYGESHAHSYNVSSALQDDRRMRQAYAPYESLCAIVGACRDGRAGAAGDATAAATRIAKHDRRPYRKGTCTAPRRGLAVDGPCGAWRAPPRTPGAALAAW